MKFFTQIITRTALLSSLLLLQACATGTDTSPTSQASRSDNVHSPAVTDASFVFRGPGSSMKLPTVPSGAIHGR